MAIELFDDVEETPFVGISIYSDGGTVVEANALSTSLEL
jgi:hypothetical protein